MYRLHRPACLEHIDVCCTLPKHILRASLIWWAQVYIFQSFLSCGMCSRSLKTCDVKEILFRRSQRCSSHSGKCVPVARWLVSNASRQRSGLVFKVRTSNEEWLDGCSTLEDETTTLSRNVVYHHLTEGQRPQMCVLGSDLCQRTSCCDWSAFLVFFSFSPATARLVSNNRPRPPKSDSFSYSIMWGVRGGAVDWGTALQAGRSRIRFPIVSLECFIDINLPAALWPWGRLNH